VDRQVEDARKHKVQQLRALGGQAETKRVEQLLHGHKDDVQRTAMHLFLDELRQGDGCGV